MAVRLIQWGGGARIKKRIGGKRWSSKFAFSRDEIDKERR